MRKAAVGLGLLCALAGSAAPAGGIVGGQPDGGRHPAIGALVGFIPQAGQEIAYCSGSLISRTVFVTAAHCGFLRTSTVKVTFDEQYSASATTYSGRLDIHPEYMPEGNTPVNDVAVVVLDKPIKHIAPVQLPTADVLDKLGLTQASRFTSVGYGDSEFVNGPGGKVTTHLQSRNYAVGSFKALTPQALHLSQNSATGDGGTCYGDSGGPNFIGAGSTETTVVAGITVTGDTYCEATNVGQRLDIASVRAFLDDYVAVP